MTEPTITIPLSWLEGVETLTPEGISKAFQDLQSLRDKVKEAQDHAKQAVGHLSRWASYLDELLNADLDDFQKRHELRKFASDTKQLATVLEGVIK